MTLTAVPDAAETRPGPRLLPLEAWLAASDADLTDPATEDHLTWLRLVSTQLAVDLIADYMQVVAGHVAAALEAGILKPGGFLAGEALKADASRAALVSAVSLVLAGIAAEAGVGEVVQS